MSASRDESEDGADRSLTERTTGAVGRAANDLGEWLEGAGEELENVEASPARRARAGAVGVGSAVNERMNEQMNGLESFLEEEVDPRLDATAESVEGAVEPRVDAVAGTRPVQAAGSVLESPGESARAAADRLRSGGDRAVTGLTAGAVGVGSAVNERMNQVEPLVEEEEVDRRLDAAAERIESTVEPGVDAVAGTRPVQAAGSVLESPGESARAAADRLRSGGGRAVTGLTAGAATAGAAMAAPVRERVESTADRLRSDDEVTEDEFVWGTEVNDVGRSEPGRVTRAVAGTQELANSGRSVLDRVESTARELADSTAERLPSVDANDAVPVSDETVETVTERKDRLVERAEEADRNRIVGRIEHGLADTIEDPRGTVGGVASSIAGSVAGAAGSLRDGAVEKLRDRAEQNMEKASGSEGAETDGQPFTADGESVEVDESAVVDGDRDLTEVVGTADGVREVGEADFVAHESGELETVEEPAVTND